jgi:RNA polymerase sigma factor (sigma-70 family)
MNETGKLVLQASSTAVRPPEREEAFASLVRRFQDMAYACAFAVTGERGLAEDAVQNALLSAWLNLDRLRDPQAFPGWLRQTVLRQAYRLAREKGTALPLEEARNVTGETADPAGAIERLDRQQVVQRLLAALPEHERMTILLFYLGEQSQREIAGFLGISVTAVKQRLHSARLRLREGGLKASPTGEKEGEMIRDSFNEDRPSRDETFAGRVQTRLRAYQGVDYAPLAGLVEAAAPGNEDNAHWLANRQDFAGRGLIPRAYVAMDAGTQEVLGYGCIEQVARPLPGDYPPTGRATTDRYRLHLIVPRQEQEQAVSTLLFDQLSVDAAELKAAGLWARLLTADEAALDVLRAHGFEERQRVEEWVLALDESVVEALTGAAETTVTTLAQERRDNAAYLKDLTTFWNTADREVAVYSEAEIEARLGRPHVVEESYFIARREGRVAGVFVVRRPPEATPRRPDTGFRVLPEVAGEDVMRRLQAAAVAYGRDQGYEAFTTHVIADEGVAARLRGMGFRQSAEMSLLEKELTG